MTGKRDRPELCEIEITSKMIDAGVRAYWEWDKYCADPGDGFLTDKGRQARLTEAAMVREVVGAVIGAHGRLRYRCKEACK